MNALSATTYRSDSAPAPGGALRLAMGAAEAMLRASGALWLAAERALVCADLHLEKGSSYAARGQLLPPYDTRETLRRLAAEVEALSPAMVVLLGDTFHDRRSEDRLAGDDAERLRALAAGRTLVGGVGHQDADGPRNLPGETAEEIDAPGPDPAPRTPARPAARRGRRPPPPGRPRPQPARQRAASLLHHRRRPDDPAGLRRLRRRPERPRPRLRRPLRPRPHRRRDRRQRRARRRLALPRAGAD